MYMYAVLASYTIVTALMSISHLSLSSCLSCWLSQEEGTIWGFVGPILVIVVVRNTVTFEDSNF